MPFSIITVIICAVNRKTRFSSADEKRALLIYLTETRSVVAAAAAPAAVAVVVVGEHEDQNDEKDPVVVVSEVHGVDLLSHLPLPYYAGREKG